MAAIAQSWGTHWTQCTPHERLVGVVVALAVHVAAAVFVIEIASDRVPMRAPIPIAVRLVKDSAKHEPRSETSPTVTPSRPAAVRQPVERKPVPQVAPAQTLATTAETAERQTAPAVEPAAKESVSPVAAAPGPVEMTPAPTAAAPTASPAAVSEPYTPPGFSAAYLSNPAPVYPMASRRSGEEGAVTLGVYVTEEGLPERVELRKSSGFARLDDAALGVVRRWKFVPARRGGAPIAAWVLVPISFSLRS